MPNETRAPVASSNSRHTPRAFERCPFLTTDRAGEYLGLSPKTLEKLRVTGGGPRFRKHGRRVVYRLDDLDAWSDGKARISTSDPGPAA
jgi:hypothetical protein